MPRRRILVDSPRTRFLLKKTLALMLVAFAILYSFGILVLFLSDPLGQSPVLDARENMALAEVIAKGQLPNEPFYRALLYPWVLSLAPNLQWAAPLFGVLCHLLNALLCALIAGQVWRHAKAAWFSGFCYAVYPVSLFFAVQILDITFALSLFLLGIFSLLRLARRCSWVFPVVAGLMAGLAVLARPNFLPPVLLFPLLGYILAYFRGKKIFDGIAVACLVGAPMISVLLAQGIVNKELSGEFRILPWQGAYNLYAANRDGANGKFYKQALVFDEVSEGMNPTRMESVYLYRQLNPEASAAPEVAAMNRFWRSRLIERVTNEPAEWLSLMIRKAIYLVNDWEQYNNLSYPYHKARLSWLQRNPLGWGLLLLGAVLAVAASWSKLRKPEAGSLFLLSIAYAAGVLLFFVSARFRLPLAPMLAVFCGGLVTVNWRQLPLKRGLLLAAIAVGSGILTFGNWSGARSHETFKQDQLLLAKASLQIGDDQSAIQFSGEALSADPSLAAARRIQVAALFNRWMELEGNVREQVWRELADSLDQLDQDDAATLFIKGVVFWRAGQVQAARYTWGSALSRYGSGAASSAGALECSQAKQGENISHLAREVRRILNR